MLLPEISARDSTPVRNQAALHAVGAACCCNKSRQSVCVAAEAANHSRLRITGRRKKNTRWLHLSSEGAERASAANSALWLVVSLTI